MLKDAGRPQDVYCNGWRPKPDMLRHEVLLTDFLLLYGTARVRRGYDVDESIRPDAELWLSGRKFNVELDTGELSHRQVEERWSLYRNVKEYLLVVTCSQARLEGLLQCAEPVSGIAMFTTLDAAKDSPHGEIWVDCFGNRVSLPRQDGSNDKSGR